MPPSLYTPSQGINDRAAFRALMAHLGISTHLVTASAGDVLAIDRTGMEQLRDHFSALGDSTQAAAIQSALDGH